MTRHEDFEKLCAAASVGQASGEELALLQEHLAGCPACRQAYSDFLQLGSVRCATDFNEREVSGAEALECIDSALFREEFLKKAEAEGIIFSREKIDSFLPEPEIRPKRRRWDTAFAMTVAASVLLGLGGAGGYHLRSRRVESASPSSPAVRGVLPSPIQSVPTDRNHESIILPESSVSHLEGENRRLTSEIASLKASLADESSILEHLQRNAAVSEQESAALLSGIQEREAKIKELRQQVSQTQAEAASIRIELTKAQEANQGALVADQVRIQELSEELAEKSSALDREREMLSANRDIRDLMSARNLHIADVFDTDTKGKTRSAFGRVFFTEGKSLLIYAYDLNDRRVQEAGYHYRVWGKKEGPGQGAKSLGIFYSDDKAQKRWVFRYEDPKVLSEIDSVFVTLEPPGKNPTEPKGEKFLYAYLRNQPNHP